MKRTSFRRKTAPNSSEVTSKAATQEPMPEQPTSQPPASEPPAPEPGSNGHAKLARYRLYNPISPRHHYTTNPDEYAALATIGWRQEGPSHYVPAGPAQVGGVTAVPLYRLYDRTSEDGLHIWTSDATEYAMLSRHGWVPEGVDGYVFPQPVPGTVPLHRLHKPGTAMHVWTTDMHERAALTRDGWRNEGLTGYVFREP